jgi:hypothetical protein
MPATIHSLDSITDPAVLALEAQAAAHARAITDCAHQYANAIRKGNVTAAHAELRSIATRLIQCEAVADRMMTVMSYDGAPELAPCRSCGAPIWRCGCEPDVGF